MSRRVSQPLSVVALRFKTDPSAVAADFQCPVLVWEATLATQQQSWERTQAHSEAAPFLGESQVFKLVKGNSSHNAFAMGVTLGRVVNNDISIAHDSVSRFHAFFQQDKTGAWTVTDAESKFGTFINDVKVEPNKHTPLPDRAVIRFGEARFQFLLPPSFLAFLQAR